MTWNYNRSTERIKRHLDGLGEIEIKKLVREANLEELLSETCCREIYGSHVYVQVSNFARLASHESDADQYKRLIQAVHIFQREVGRIAESTEIFGGMRVHFQGAKVHVLFYRPIDDACELATKACLLQLVLKDFVHAVFNPAFPNYDDFTVAGGADIGSAIGTRNGMRGDRELLFLGAPANHAAKILGSNGQLRLTVSLHEALPKELQELCCSTEEGVHQLQLLGSRDLDGLLKMYGIKWDREASAERIRQDKRSFPLNSITYGAADVLIDLDDLSIHNNKRVLAASIFGDVTGFTSYIDAARNEDQKRAALRVFHVIRKEMACVVQQDFAGLRIQFQGDRVQGLFHLPKDGYEAIANKAVETAIGLQSSMEHTLKACLPESQELRLAVGVDIGSTLVTKLGTRAHRDRICLGEAVETAAKHEEKSQGGQIGISKQVYEALCDSLQKQFQYSSTTQCYIANDLTVGTLEMDALSESIRADRPIFLSTTSGGLSVTSQKTPDAKPFKPSRPYGPKP